MVALNAEEVKKTSETTDICGIICFVLKPEPRITTLSPAVESMFGFREENKNWLQVVRKAPSLLLSIEGTRQLMACIRSIREKQEPALFVGDLYNVAFQRIPVRSMISRYTADDHEAFCATVYDMRQERKAQADALKDTCVMALSTACEWIGEMNPRENTAQCVFCRGGDKSKGRRVVLDDAMSFRLNNQVAEKDSERLHAFFEKNVRPGVEPHNIKTIYFDIREPSGLSIPCKGILISLGDDRFLFSGMHLHIADEPGNADHTSARHVMISQSDFEALCSRNLIAKNWQMCFNLLFLIAIDAYDTYANEKRNSLENKVIDLLERKEGANCVFARFSENCFVLCHHELGDDKKRVDCADNLFQELSNSLAPANGSVSMGVAACTHDPEKGYRCAFDKAKQALAKAQAAGGGRYVFYFDHALPKGSAEKVKNRTAKGHVVEIITFGYFNVLVDGVPICFSHNKAKELLALLVDRRGGYAASGNLISYLWENEPLNKLTSSRLRKVVMRLKETLRQYDVEDIIESSSGMRRIIPEKINCDLYDYLACSPDEREQLHANYLMDYSWGEDTHGELMNQTY
ncbi:MAG: hypothetical protein IJ214_00355 [Clostridia bacterium]|nr:hypothetical protein [Clostridia bacterium]